MNYDHWLYVHSANMLECCWNACNTKQEQEKQTELWWTKGKKGKPEQKWQALKLMAVAGLRQPHQMTNLNKLWRLVFLLDFVDFHLIFSLVVRYALTRFHSKSLRHAAVRAAIFIILLTLHNQLTFHTATDAIVFCLQLMFFFSRCSSWLKFKSACLYLCNLKSQHEFWHGKNQAFTLICGFSLIQWMAVKR